MSDDQTTREHVRVAGRYFGSFVEDYHQAFQGRGRNPLHAAINRLFRRRTFQLRTEIIRGLLARHGVAGKLVLDLGCGSGEVSIEAARLGARVLGLDVVEGMVEVARREAAAAGLASATEFRVHDITQPITERADVALLVGVIEYYRDLQPVLERAAGAARELVIIADTRGPWWRRGLRWMLARAKHFYLYYRSPDAVAVVMARLGFVEAARIPGHSYTIMAYRRRADA